MRIITLTGCQFLGYALTVFACLARSQTLEVRLMAGVGGFALLASVIGFAWLWNGEPISIPNALGDNRYVVLGKSSSHVYLMMQRQITGIGSGSAGPDGYEQVYKIPRACFFHATWEQIPDLKTVCTVAETLSRGERMMRFVEDDDQEHET